MKTTSLKFFTLLMALTFSFGFTSCKQKPSTPEHLNQTIDYQSKEYNSAYVCPMHCEGSGSDSEGKCPVCGMDYVANKDYVAPEPEPEEEAVDSVELDA